MDEAYRYLKQLFQLSHDAVLGVRGGAVVFANAAAERLWERTVEGSAVSELFPPEFDPEAETRAVGSMRIGQRQAAVSVSREEDLTLVCVTPASGGAPEAVDFSAVIPSLNGSMQTLRSAAKFLIENVDLSEERARLTAAILMRSCFLVLRTLNNIDTLEQLRARTIPFQPGWSDLAASLDSLLRSAESMVSPLGLKVIFNRPEGDIYARFDEKLIGQLVLNLLSNSLLHMERGSAVTVTLRAESERISLSVDDKGGGMDAQTFRELFQSPPRGDLADLAAGAGLGLGIVKGIVELHGGQILVSSLPEKGTSVRVVFPRGELSDPRLKTDPEIYQSHNQDHLLRELSGVLKSDAYQLNYLD